MTDRKPTRTPLRRIHTPKGDVLHAIKADDTGFVGFGEAYFSQVVCGAIKGWKRHRKMTLNLICPVGAVRVVVLQDREAATVLTDTILSPETEERYQRLTVPAMLWFGFQGIGPDLNLLLNVASHPHDPDEAETADFMACPWPEERALIAAGAR